MKRKDFRLEQMHHLLIVIRLLDLKFPFDLTLSFKQSKRGGEVDNFENPGENFFVLLN
jgi:hypothetical protein